MSTEGLLVRKIAKKERDREQSIEREREKERKKKKREREKEVRAEWGEYEQISEDELEITLAGSKKKKNKKAIREAEKENWMHEVDKYEEYRNTTRKGKRFDKEFDAREYANKVYRYDNGGEWAATSDMEAELSGRSKKKKKQRQRKVIEVPREKSENHSKERGVSRRSRSHSAKRRDRSRRSYSRSRSRGRDRSSRGHSLDRRKDRRSPKRRERSRSRDIQFTCPDKNRRGRRKDDRESPYNRKNSNRRTSRSRTPPRKERRRSKHKSRSRSPKRDKEYYRQKDREDYRGSVAIFAHSLKEVTEPQKASNRRVKMSKKHPERLEVDVEQAISMSDRRDRASRRRHSSEKESDEEDVTILAVKEAPARKRKKKRSKHASDTSNTNNLEAPDGTTTTSLAPSRSGRTRIESSPETTRPVLTGEPDDPPMRSFQAPDFPPRSPRLSSITPPVMSPPSDTYDPSRPTEEPSPIHVTCSPVKHPSPHRKRKTTVEAIFCNITPPTSGTDGEGELSSRKADKPLQPLLPPILQDEILMRHHRPLGNALVLVKQWG